MIKEAMDELGERASNAQIKNYILEHYTDVNPSTINAQINVCTVNRQSRINYQENRKPRLANDARYDYLYSSRAGNVERYDPAKHGNWEIRMTDDGFLEVGEVGKKNEGMEDVDEIEEQGEVIDRPQFFLERHLEEFLILNFETYFGPQLTIYQDSDGITGRQYATDIGLIDILAVDQESNFVVIELKKGRESDKVVGQILRYIGWVKLKLCTNGQDARGIIICKEAEEKLTYALVSIPHVTLKYYTVGFQLRDQVSP